MELQKLETGGVSAKRSSSLWAAVAPLAPCAPCRRAAVLRLDAGSPLPRVDKSTMPPPPASLSSPAHPHSRNPSPLRCTPFPAAGRRTVLPPPAIPQQADAAITSAWSVSPSPPAESGREVRTRRPRPRLPQPGRRPHLLSSSDSGRGGQPRPHQTISRISW